MNAKVLLHLPLTVVRETWLYELDFNKFVLCDL